MISSYRIAQLWTVLYFHKSRQNVSEDCGQLFCAGQELCVIHLKCWWKIVSRLTILYFILFYFIYWVCVHTHVKCVYVICKCVNVEVTGYHCDVFSNCSSTLSSETEPFTEPWNDGFHQIAEQQVIGMHPSILVSVGLAFLCLLGSGTQATYLNKHLSIEPP